MLQNSFTVTIQSIKQETPQSITLTFDALPDSWSYAPGQFVTLIVSIGEKTFQRSYSLYTSPYTDALPGITIKRVPGGIVSNYLNDELRVGDTLKLLPAAGHFTTVYDPTQVRKLVLIAGGSGITPLFSILKSVLHQEPKSRVLLINANRSEEDMMYKNELQSLADSYAANFALVPVLSRPSSTWQGLQGRLTASELQRLLGQEVGDDYFVCGPKGLMELACRTLLSMGVPKAHVHTESFTLAAGDDNVPATLCHTTVHYEGEVYTYQAPASKTVLEAALDEGIDLPYACNSGMCNVCQAKCVTGQVRMCEDEGLTDEELAQGYVLTCVSHPTTDKIVIKVD